MGLRDRMKRLRSRAAHLLPERVTFVSRNGEEVTVDEDPLDVLVADWKATTEGRPSEAPPYLEPGWRLKDPESVSDPMWRMIDDVARRMEDGA